MKKLIPLLLLSACTHGSVHVENDYLNPFEKNSDKYYTHGTQLTYTNTIEKKEREHYSIGQLIYTPSQKRADANPKILRRDRPYSGWLYGEYRNVIRRDSQTTDSFGFQLGCSGGCSYAKETQSGVHKLLDQNVPTWRDDFSLKSEPGFILFGQRNKDLYANDISDFGVYAGGKFGNIIDSASGGFIYRIGHSLDEKSGGIIFKEAKDDELRSPWIYYVFIQAEQRLVLYNHMLEGSLWQNERHTVDAEPFVREGNIGFVIGYENFKFGYTYTVFSNEWKERLGSFAFGGIDLSW